MQIMGSSSALLLLLYCCLTASQANRIYVHPFYLFAAENVSCETLQSQSAKPLETRPVPPLSNEVPAPEPRETPAEVRLRQNITQRLVLAELLNTLGLRMYQALSTEGANALISPVNTYGSLVSFYLGASKKTASSYQLLLGLNRDTDREDCVSLVDGHAVLQTLQDISSRLDDGPKDEIITQVWAFTRSDASLSADFIQGIKDFSDTSFIRGVDFSRPQEAEALVNSFTEKTSQGKVKSLFKDLSPIANMLFASSFTFKGNWQTAFQPDNTSLQEFYVNETATVMVPMMTREGQYNYMIDKVRQVTIIKLPLSKYSYMLLILPNEGVRLSALEGKLRNDVIFSWHRNLNKGLLELSLPRFSMSSVTDLHQLLANMSSEIETKLLGSQADFEQLSTTKPFTIDKALNKVMFEMSEEGEGPQEKTKEAGIPSKLTVNRPFFFSVVEGDSNAFLMLGKIVNPTL